MQELHKLYCKMEVNIQDISYLLKYWHVNTMQQTLPLCYLPYAYKAILAFGTNITSSTIHKVRFCS